MLKTGVTAMKQPPPGGDPRHAPGHPHPRPPHPYITHHTALSKIEINTTRRLRPLPICPPKKPPQNNQKIESIPLEMRNLLKIGAGPRFLSPVSEVVNRMQPKYVSFLTAMIVPTTPLMTFVEKGQFQPLTDRAILHEARNMLAGLDMTDTLFRMNHVSNLIDLGGRLPGSKMTLISQLYALIPRASNAVTFVCTEAEGLML